MRLDLFLKKTFLVRQRSAAKAACDAGLVRVNGQVAKASALVRPGDTIAMLLPRRDLEVRVLDLPHGNVAKRDATRYVEIRRDAPRDAAGAVFDAPAD